ncbi:MAG TPA: transcriptional regulator [Dehalococcoidia bacterium]|jgi:hypothetical protein|nr:transcriptional regulator [Dehalococcoidia bacterium]
MATGAEQIPVARCQDCGHYFAPPVYSCAACGSGRIIEAHLSGRGKLATYTIIRVPPLGFEGQAPYTVAIIELEEGLKVPARLDNDPVSNDLELFTPAHFVARRDGVYWFQIVTQR